MDSSGVRIWHTPTLRTYDAGGMGALFLHETDPSFPTNAFLPPGIITTITSFCETECTFNENTEMTSVQAYASSVHAHQRATAIKLRHIRDGVELEPLANNEHYDFKLSLSSALLTASAVSHFELLHTSATSKSLRL